jgi:GDP-4-dehydro-6-deoxy-D-mannose reductase
LLREPEAMRVLITGGSGFVGRVVQEEWSDVVVWPRSADLTDPGEVDAQVEKLDGCFDAVLHLAAQSDPHLSLSCPVETWNVNLLGTVHLLEALAGSGWQGPFLFVSSGAVYGKITGVVTERSPVSPGTPYVASKLSAEIALAEWGRRTGNRVVVARAFNHSGPGQSTSFFLPSIARQINALPEGGGEIEVGNLEVQRDFGHVRDVVRAYRALLEKGKDGEIYNLASGLSVKLSAVLEKMARLSGRPVTTRVTPERFRPEDTRPIKVNLDKIRQDTGWSPELGLDTLLSDLVADWKNRDCQNEL